MNANGILLDISKDKLIFPRNRQRTSVEDGTDPTACTAPTKQTVPMTILQRPLPVNPGKEALTPRSNLN